MNWHERRVELLLKKQREGLTTKETRELGLMERCVEHCSPDKRLDAIHRIINRILGEK